MRCRCCPHYLLRHRKAVWVLKLKVSLCFSLFLYFIFSRNKNFNRFLTISEFCVFWTYFSSIYKCFRATKNGEKLDRNKEQGAETTCILLTTILRKKMRTNEKILTNSIMDIRWNSCEVVPHKICHKQAEKDKWKLAPSLAPSSTTRFMVIVMTQLFSHSF